MSEDRNRRPPVEYLDDEQRARANALVVAAHVCPRGSDGVVSVVDVVSVAQYVVTGEDPFTVTDIEPADAMGPERHLVVVQNFGQAGDEPLPGGGEMGTVCDAPVGGGGDCWLRAGHDGPCVGPHPPTGEQS